MIPTADLHTAATMLCPGGRVAEVVTLEGGSSAFVARLRLECLDGELRDVVFRQHTNRAGKGHRGRVAEKEFHVLTHLAAGGFEVPRPLALHGDAADDGPWLLMEWVDGSTVSGVDGRLDHDEALPAMASFLVRLHAVDPSLVPTTALDRIEDPAQALGDYLGDDQLGCSIREQLDLGIARRPNADVLLHGDFWPGNIMIRDRDLIAVLDWEDAALGDPLADLASARVELTCASGENTAQMFTDRYLDEAPHLDLHDLALWDVYVSASALSAMHLWGLQPDHEARQRATTRSFCQAAAERLASS